MANDVVVTPFTGSLKVAVMLFATATAVAFTAGARAVTVGGTVSPVVPVTVTGADGADSAPITVPATEATVNVMVPTGSPVTTTGEAVPVAVWPVLAVTRKPVIAGVLAGGAVKLTDACVPVTSAATAVGAAGPAGAVPAGTGTLGEPAAVPNWT